MNSMTNMNNYEFQTYENDLYLKNKLNSEGQEQASGFVNMTKWSLNAKSFSPLR